MSISRVFVNNKRLSTGRTMKDTTFLQVYPELKSYPSEAFWRSAWTDKIRESITFKVEEVPPPKKSRAPKQTSEPKPVEQNKHNWICSYCNKGPGNDHRMCICHGFNYSVQAWEDGRIWPESTPSSTPPETEEGKLDIRGDTSNKETIHQKKNSKVIDWTFYPDILKVVAPPGKYYIGDLCYALYDSTYDDVYGSTGYESGLYECKDGFFMVDHTSYGDGSYKGTDRKEYLVDAGIIGIASMKVVDKNNSCIEGGQVYTFTEPVTVRFNSGVFNFTSGTKSFRIDTCGYCSDEESSEEE